MQDKFNQLREKHPVFTYDRYEIVNQADKLVITYFFTLGDFVTFKPRWEFVKKHKDINYEEEGIVNRLAFNLGLVELISYWKCACSPLVRIKAGVIDEEQIRWWKQQYFLGLGEFFYTNRIKTDINNFMKVEVIPRQERASDTEGIPNDIISKGETVSVAEDIPMGILSIGDTYKNMEHKKSGCLIPIGGGKDSVVTMELLSDRKDSNLCYMINKKETSIKCAELAGYSGEEIVIEKRIIDSGLLTLNKEGYLNGHTPFSAVVAFSSVLAAYLYDKEYVVLSNESSANESTVEGTEVNHQYSKSYKFELDFITYEKQYIGSGVNYFSLLRPFSEFQIAKFFAKQEKYHKVFHSCNVGSKADIWCGACPKCLFVYIILSPFIELERLTEIFGKDMLNDESLTLIFDKLIGAEPEKPFECVGTCDEINTAIILAMKERELKNLELPVLYRHYKKNRLYALYSGQKDNPYFDYYNDENSVPEVFVSRLKNLMLK